MAKILIVDDVAANRELLASVLGYRGHETVQAANGAQAVIKARAERPDLVICDVYMPLMDGYEFVRALRSEPDIAGIRVVFYTSYTLNSEAQKLAHSYGVLDFLEKPCEPEDILRVSDKALARNSGESK